jgi:hypothetical protein
LANVFHGSPVVGWYWRKLLAGAGRLPLASESGRSPPAVFAHAVELLGRIHVTLKSFFAVCIPATVR